MKRYKAPWGPLLIIMSSLHTALCLGLAYVFFKQGGMASFWIGMLSLMLVLSCALFTIRGYTVTQDAILIHRLFWATRLSLADLQSAQVQAIQPWRGIRIGNGGFFSFTGFRYNTRLGFIVRL